MFHVIEISVRKEMFYLQPQFRTLLLKNQEIVMFNRGSTIIIDIYKMYLEASTLVTFWMDMTPSLIMIKRGLLRATPMKRDTKDLHITIIYMK